MELVTIYPVLTEYFVIGQAVLLAGGLPVILRVRHCFAWSAGIAAGLLALCVAKNALLCDGTGEHPMTMISHLSPLFAIAGFGLVAACFRSQYHRAAFLALLVFAVSAQGLLLAVPV